MRGLIVPASDLLFGARCAGCGGPAMLLCRACGGAVRPDPQVVRLAVAPHGIPAVAAGPHAGLLRRIVLGWKEEGVTRLTDVLAHHVAASVITHLTPEQPVLLVPVPTSRRSRRARGCDLVDDLARAAARLLSRAGVDVSVEQALAVARATADQAGLDADARRANLDGAFRPRRIRAGTGDIVLVDDVLTTGSTVSEAVRALAEVGRRPVGISAIAATPRRS